MPADRLQKYFDQKLLQTKMSSAMSFTFNLVELCIVTIDEKTCTHTREVCKALEYGKATKATDIVKHLCSRENYAHK